MNPVSKDDVNRATAPNTRAALQSVLGRWLKGGKTDNGWVGGWVGNVQLCLGPVGRRRRQARALGERDRPVQHGGVHLVWSPAA